MKVYFLKSRVWISCFHFLMAVLWSAACAFISHQRQQDKQVIDDLR